VGNRAPEGKAVEANKKPRKAVPKAMLVVLLAAFGGALALKAWEERQSADTAILTQQSREAVAVASHVRAELVSSRARMEGLLLTGASLDAIRKGAHFDTVAEHAPAEGAWAQLIDQNNVRVFAQDSQGKWVSGVRSAKSFMPVIDRRGLYLASVANAPVRPSFQMADGQRLAVACSPIDGADIAACVSRTAPLLDLGDLNRAIIYMLLLAAPLLAVIGLLQVIGKLQLANRDTRPATQPNQILLNTTSINPAFEVAGVIGFWRWDPKSQRLTLSAQAASLLGALRSGEMTLDEFSSLLSEDDRRKVIATLANASPLGRINIAFRGVGASAGAYFELIGGCADSVFTGAVLNVTDRVAAQHRSSRAEAVARAALAAHPGPFAIWDSRKRLTHWNAAFQRVFNLDKSIVTAGASYDFIMAEISKFIRVERPLGDDANAREVLLLSDQWVRLVDRRMARDGLITVGLDISALKRQEVTLSRNDKRLRTMVVELERTRGQAQELAARHADQKARAERASQAKSVFLANMSHELRTPLNAINGFSERLVGEVCGPLGNEKYKGYAEDILGSGQHLLDMINDILDMAKIEAGKWQITPRLIDASDAVDAAVRMIRRRANDKQVALNFDPDDDLPEINGDHLAIKQMTLNLVSNAIKFTSEGGEISVAVLQEDDWLVIRVADNGCGIPENDLPRLGQPFEQAQAPEGRNTQGTGLGLALTKSFAEMHGGYLSIESEIKVGTTVSIYLPIPREAPAASASSQMAATHDEDAEI
jgi:two-component system cell cycle sensor histidine kinase PleC